MPSPYPGKDAPPAAPDADTEEERRRALVLLDKDDLKKVEQIGVGSTATVFRGFHKDHEVAIKVICMDRRTGTKERSDLEREVSILTEVTHDRLVGFLGIAREPNAINIVTQYCAGGVVFDLLHCALDVDLSTEQQRRMCIDVAAGMEYLHGLDPVIIHRDLKSPNLLLESPVTSAACIPRVKVSDFGLSRIKGFSGESQKMTRGTGTVQWMAPEVYNGQNYDEKVDVFSYAMIMYETLAREIPFGEEDESRVGELISGGYRPDVSYIPPDSCQVLLDIMLACWGGAPALRPTFSKIVMFLKHCS